MKRLHLILIMLLSFSFLFADTNIDSLMVYGRVMLDTAGLEDVKIGPVVTDSEGYYSFKLPAGIDTTLTPHLNAFLFSPASYEISAEDTVLDSINFTASRQVKKVIIISGQSNAENMGEPQKHFITDEVDRNIPYYLAYCYGDFGFSTLGLLTKFGYSYEYCKGYDKGFGLEMLLARTLYKHYTDSLGVIKTPYSGTSLDSDWKPDGATWQWFLEKQEKAVDAYREYGYEPEYIGFFWFQGESDETPLGSSHYRKNLREFVDRIRERFPNSSELENLPFICVQINWNPDSPYEEPVRQAQMDLPNQRADCACVDIDDCNRLRYSSKNAHFNGNALNRIGYKLATTYLDMVGQPVDSTITVTVNINDHDMENKPMLSVSGDTTFFDGIEGTSYSFLAKLGDNLNFSVYTYNEDYESSPALIRVPFAYHPSAILDGSYTFRITSVVKVGDYPGTMEHLLMDSYPNPFNPVTLIDLQLPTFSHVELCIYDLQGKKVTTLVNMLMEKGTYQVKWDASGKPSGIYMARLIAADQIITTKMLLMK
ncbi:MAG: T9SS type A sorting domain-containing protein [Candidatus Marinimicrobia bacterium]|nr:T9SS type A sorting domain-containing protein [Candidatus Neomarinimicrobiota bacterium]